MSNTDKKFYKEYKQFNPTEIEQSINAFWKSNDIFKKASLKEMTVQTSFFMKVRRVQMECLGFTM